ncbi:hypothetical protein DU69_19530 [Methanosarcina mazei]|jgi:hypothetical protein|uniref:Uncharacterized protein n=1 Tax=Methanosarcina mazei TaxID=2209 RepID=A0A0F8PN07_METMZ|nr:hypothetical protein DU34_02825 [Methanosarcina mazei]KKG34612.1 hypothetical protein DU49_19645 [Methanosarcina mazei]KKG41431.1 hypothetical protein DU35_02790 [Methanosarcina mazei]KKG41592.1 hypothetical protein DU41_12610 [Methanosarcina mazei]KKG44214.1 hypothetical protein DU39_19550 [Methanosarcina mazei]
MYETLYQVLVTNLPGIIGLWIGINVSLIFRGYKQKWSFAKTLSAIILADILAYTSVFIWAYSVHAY